MQNSPKIFTLKQVVSSIRKTIEERYQQTYWVKAEMHKLNRFPSGHCFPEILQKEDGKIVAQISGSIWKHNFERINQRFIDVVKEPLKEDTTLLMHVKVSFHEMYGLSLQILDIDPSYALGELQRERQETLKRLQKEGLINANQRLDFPLLPQRVAVISAESSKGLKDFQQVIETNQWGYAFFTMLFPAYLQGDNAVKTIIAQLKQIERVKDHFDVVVIVRGGGGEVGLSCYNNYELCKAISTFPLPILTGIGHSTNMTVSEMVAFRNAITPTELADFLLQAFHSFSIPLQDAAKGVKQHSMALVKESNHELRALSSNFRNIAAKAVVKNQHSLVRSSQKLLMNTRTSIQHNRQVLQRDEQEVVSASRTLLRAHKHQLEVQGNLLPIRAKSIFQANQNNLNQIIQSIRLMDPINVLKRGYSITTLAGKTINDKNQPSTGEKVITRTATFTLESEVTNITNLEDE
jgi:exodeoxyribonuclease VII large subunit